MSTVGNIKGGVNASFRRIGPDGEGGNTMPGFSMGFMTVICRKNFGFWRNSYGESL